MAGKVQNVAGSDHSSRVKEGRADGPMPGKGLCSAVRTFLLIEGGFAAVATDEVAAEVNFAHRIPFLGSWLGMNAAPTWQGWMVICSHTWSRM